MFSRPGVTYSALYIVVVTSGCLFLRSMFYPVAETALSAVPPGVPGARAEAGPLQPGPMDLSRWDAMMKISDPTARMRSLLNLLGGLQQDDFAPSAERLMVLGVAVDSQEMELLISAWCNVDVQAAASFALKHEVPGLISVVLEEWGRRDYDEAVEWTLRIPRNAISMTREYAFARVILTTVERDPGRALSTLLRVLKPSFNMYRGDFFAQQVMAAIMCHCPGRIEGLIGSMPEGPEKEMVTDLMVGRIADPGGASSFIGMRGGALEIQIDRIPDITPKEIAMAAAAIARKSRKNPEELLNQTLAEPGLFLKYALADEDAATSLVESMPAGATRENALAGVAAAIASRDGITAGLAYLEGSPEETRRLLLDEWACHVAPQNPAKVLDHADLLADFPDGKCRLLIGMAYAYLRDSDNEAAERWVADHPEFETFVRRKPH